jgi:hypothetical protein
VVETRLLIAAPSRLGEVIANRARADGQLADWFHTPSSRDPTLELPHVARRLASTLVVIVDPDREEPATFELIRAAGATVVAWVTTEPARFPRRPARLMLARQRWIVRAADAVAVTVSRRTDQFCDRSGRVAGVIAVPRDLGDTTAVAATFHALLALAGDAARPPAEGSR